MGLSRPSLPFPPPLAAFRRFVRLEASGGIVLLVCAIVALVWANSPFADRYFAIWSTYLRELNERGLSRAGAQPPRRN